MASSTRKSLTFADKAETVMLLPQEGSDQREIPQSSSCRDLEVVLCLRLPRTATRAALVLGVMIGVALAFHISGKIGPDQKEAAITMHSGATLELMEQQDHAETHHEQLQQRTKENNKEQDAKDHTSTHANKGRSNEDSNSVSNSKSKVKISNHSDTDSKTYSNSSKSSSNNRRQNSILLIKQFLRVLVEMSLLIKPSTLLL
eukprot:TRINITY_DN2288_c2_g1_i3.p1 TRINITY_DN2288_c2_g1~~TRINITY_DN2288_c2_g1_i3.p1  ORF type:complete len:202 (-),score=37.20 TRINITY_DN2288_c2_g1_i3:12-617(-)